MPNKTQEERINLFHFFKDHKKEPKKCTPCKHIKFFLMYEEKHGDKLYGKWETISPKIEFDSYDKGFNNSKEIIAVKANVNSITHSNFKSVSLENEDHFINCVTYFKLPKINSWVSHMVLCNCDKYIIKWVS